MTGHEFLRKLRRFGDQSGVPVRIESKRGKGSHSTLYFGEARTVIQDLKKELPAGTMRAMLRQIGLSPRDLEKRGPR
jgi:mRNA interferase HicA